MVVAARPDSVDSDSEVLVPVVVVVSVGDSAGPPRHPERRASEPRDARTCLLCCHGFVTGLVGAAQRVLSLGHTDAQRILHDLQPVMTEAAADSADRGIDEMSPFAPLIDVLSANHERADRRLFMS